jgi:hypothetical protein
MHTHQKIHALEGWDILSHVQHIVKKIKEDNPKTKKIDRTLS